MTDDIRKQFRMAYHSIKCSWLRLGMSVDEAEKYATDELADRVSEARQLYPNLGPVAFAAQVSRLSNQKG